MQGVVNLGPQDDSAVGIPTVATTGTGAAYVATVEGITALTTGLMITVIPHVVSTSTTPTLNVNGLGAKQIRRQLSTSTAGTTAGSSASWLTANKPVLLQYNGTYWIAQGKEQPMASDMSGTLPLSNGGTGATTAAAALHALINGVTALTASNLADGDMLALDDVSDATGKKISMAALVAYLSGRMGGAKIQTGSYVGTGTYGSSNPCSLTFDFKPQLIVIWREISAGYNAVSKYELMQNLYVSQGIMPGSGRWNAIVTNGSDSDYGKILQWGNTVIFFANNRADYQPNDKNVEYYYFAIG